MSQNQESFKGVVGLAFRVVGYLLIEQLTVDIFRGAAFFLVGWLIIPPIGLTAPSLPLCIIASVIWGVVTGTGAYFHLMLHRRHHQMMNPMQGHENGGHPMS